MMFHKIMALMFVVCSSFVWAEKTTQKNISKTDLSTKETNLSFEDLLVQGKYHFSEEAVTTVEQDKVLDALLGVRKDFRDRIVRSSEVF